MLFLERWYERGTCKPLMGYSTGIIPLATVKKQGVISLPYFFPSQKWSKEREFDGVLEFYPDIT